MNSATIVSPLFSGIALVILFASSLTLAQAQNCGITGANNGATILTERIKEKTEANATVWTGPIFNVTASVVVPSPYVKYIKGLRYATRYEYQTEEAFKTFVQDDRVLNFTREVIFTCEDGRTVQYTFVVDVDDENTEPPKFLHPVFNATVSLSSEDTSPIVADICAYDEDVHLKNANLFFRSSNPYITLLAQPQFGPGIPRDYYEYCLELIVNRAYFEVGVYRIIITTDDGRHSAFAYLDLTLLP